MFWGDGFKELSFGMSLGNVLKGVFEDVLGDDFCRYLV